MKALTPLAETMVTEQGRGLVALVLCPILLAGCAGAGLQSSGLAGPSWQQREALHLQEGTNHPRRAQPPEERRWQRQVEDAVVSRPVLLAPAASNYYYCRVQYYCTDGFDVTEGWGSAWQPAADYQHNAVCEAAQQRAVDAGERNCSDGSVTFGGTGPHARELPLAEDCDCGLVDEPPQ